MRKSFWILFSVIVWLPVTYLRAQSPQPAPTPPKDDVVRITTNLVQLDVTVTDSRGRIVTDLKPEEVEIYQNGQKQPISNFSFISAPREVAKTSKTPEPSADAPPTLASTLRPEQIRRTIALVVDDLSLSFDSAYYTRKALKKYVDEQMQDGDLVAVIRTGAGVGALQQFTADKRLLYAAIDRVRWNPQGTGGISAFAPILPSVFPGGDNSEADAFEQDMQNFRNIQASTGALGALGYVVNGMSELPGRKSVVLFSHGFRLMEEDRHGFSGGGQVIDEMKRLIDAATRASVVFYAIDPRGLQYTGPTAADSISGADPGQIGRLMSSRSMELYDTQEGLRYLAQNTGGLAIVNNNDLTGGLRKVLNDQSYYLVGYIPDTDTFDRSRRRYNNLEVKVLRPGLSVRYRSGFINVAETADSKELVDRARGSANYQLQSALMSPFAVNGVNLRLNALFVGDQKNQTYIRSLLHIDPANIKFSDEPNGTKKAVFDLLGVIFGDNGQPVQQIGKTYALTLTPESYEKAQTVGLVYGFLFLVKTPGAYQYRVAVRDTSGGAVGSASQFVEIPDLKKKRLTVSSIGLESLSAEEWQIANTRGARPAKSDPFTTTAERRVKPGSVLRYVLGIYHPKLDSAKRPQLMTRVRVYRDGQLLFDGNNRPMDLTGQTDMEHPQYVGAVSLGSKLEPGDYALQIIVTDTLAKKKQQMVSQAIQFEVLQ